MKKHKLAFLLSHPIQYYSPMLAELAKHPGIDLTVFYCSDKSVKGTKDKGFNRELKWDIPLLKGYKSKELNKLKQEISDYDAIIMHGWHYPGYWPVYLNAILRKIPFLVRSENPLNQELLKSKWKIAAKKLILGNLFRKSSGLLAIGGENKDFYEFYGVNTRKIFNVPYAVDNERFVKGYNKLKNRGDKIKKELGISPEKKIILFAGKLIRKKRPFDLLKAYEKIDFRNKALVFVGDGKLRKKLEEHVKENNIKEVYFTGFKNQTELPEYYAIADVFVLPSGVGETWGLVVNEAMCFSLPIIVSGLVGCGKDLVKHNKNGFVFKTGNVPGLKGYLVKLLKDKRLRQSMGKKSFEMIKEWNYSKDVDGIVKALDSINRVKLNLGSGPYAIKGWENLDASLSVKLSKLKWLYKPICRITGTQEHSWSKEIKHVDVRKGLPYPDNSVGAVFSSHMLEHLTQEQGGFVVKECCRCLKQGGVIRLIVPDKAKHKGKNEKKRKILKNLSHSDHKYMYDESTLRNLLKKQGFRDIKRRKYGQSLIKNIEKVEVKERHNNSICLEAVK